MTEEEEFEFRARLEAEQQATPVKPRIDPATIVEPNAEQRRMGLRKNRLKDDNLAGNVGRGFLNFGEDVGRETRLAALDYGASPGVANVAGFTGDMAANLIPIPLGGGGAKAVAAPLSEYAAKNLMWKALKPPRAAQLSGDAEAAVETLLSAKGARVSEGGVENMTKTIDSLDNELTGVLKNSTDKVSTEAAVAPIKDAIKKFRYGLDQADDKAAILKEVEKFFSHSEVRGALDIPVETAQLLKRGISRELGDKAFALGNKTAAEQEGKLAIRGGLADEIVRAAPEARDINRSMSELINARNLANERALMAHNLHISGLGWLNPKMMIPWMIERNPFAMSILARSINRGTPAGILGQGTVGSAELLNEATK